MDLMPFGIGAQRQAYEQVHGSYLCEEVLAAWLITFAGVFEVGKAHLAHGRLGSGGRSIFAYPGLVRRFPKHVDYPVEQLASVLSCCDPISADLAQCLELAGVGNTRTWLAEQAAYDAWQLQQA